MPITIFAGGCRVASEEEGKFARNYCDTCPQSGNCEAEPRARELERLATDQWVKSGAEAPPHKQPILFLEHSSLTPLDTVRYGHYDRVTNKYQEFASGKTLPQEFVIAWMPVPRVPSRIYRKH